MFPEGIVGFSGTLCHVDDGICRAKSQRGEWMMDESRTGAQDQIEIRLKGD